MTYTLHFSKDKIKINITYGKYKMPSFFSHKKVNIFIHLLSHAFILMVYQTHMSQSKNAAQRMEFIVQSCSKVMGQDSFCIVQNLTGSIPSVVYACQVALNFSRENNRW